MVKDDDVREVMDAEKRRGRRPVDISARERRNRELQTIRQMMWECDEKRFREIIVQLGLAEGSPRYEAALAAWHEAQRRRRP